MGCSVLLQAGARWEEGSSDARVAAVPSGVCLSACPGWLTWLADQGMSEDALAVASGERCLVGQAAAGKILELARVGYQH